MIIDDIDCKILDILQKNARISLRKQWVDINLRMKEVGVVPCFFIKKSKFLDHLKILIGRCTIISCDLNICSGH